MIATKETNYLRDLAFKASPYLNSSDLASAASQLSLLLPEAPDLEVSYISSREIERSDLVHIGSSGSLITAASGNLTNVRTTFDSLFLGQGLYEAPPPESLLNPDSLSTFIRHSRPLAESEFTERLISNAKRVGINPSEVRDYVMERIPMSTLWISSAVYDALSNLNSISGGALLDADGRLLQHISSQALLINAESGAGVISVHHDRSEGRIHPYTVTDILTPTQTGFIANLFGFSYTESNTGACAASGKAIHLAERYAKDRENQRNLFVIVSAYDGPSHETQEVFARAGIPTGIQLPYLHIEQQGYSEAQGVSVNVLLTKELLDELGISLPNMRVIKSRVDQGISLYGVDKKIPASTYKGLFEQLCKVLPKEYSGPIALATHGVNTMGWLFEIDALRELKQQYFPTAHFYLTSTQPQLGHPYAPRSGTSLEILAAASDLGLMPGMARAAVDLSELNQSNTQTQRQRVVGKYLPGGLESEAIIFSRDSDKAEKNRDKAVRRLESLRKERIMICLASEKIPKHTPIFVVHTGLGGESAGLYGVTIKN